MWIQGGSGIDRIKEEEEENMCWKKVEMEDWTRWCLVIPCGHYIIRKTPSHGHALLLVDQQGVLFHFDVLLQALFVPKKVTEGLVPLLELVLQDLDAVGNL